MENEEKEESRVFVREMPADEPSKPFEFEAAQNMLTEAWKKFGEEEPAPVVAVITALISNESSGVAIEGQISSEEATSTVCNLIEHLDAALPGVKERVTLELMNSLMEEGLQDPESEG